jgi:hypothetical protein
VVWGRFSEESVAGDDCVAGVDDEQAGTALGIRQGDTVFLGLRECGSSGVAL